MADDRTLTPMIAGRSSSVEGRLIVCASHSMRVSQYVSLIVCASNSMCVSQYVQESLLACMKISELRATLLPLISLTVGQNKRCR